MRCALLVGSFHANLYAVSVHAIVPVLYICGCVVLMTSCVYVGVWCIALLADRCIAFVTKKVERLAISQCFTLAICIAPVACPLARRIVTELLHGVHDCVYVCMCVCANTHYIIYTRSVLRIITIYLYLVVCIVYSYYTSDIMIGGYAVG